MDVTCPGTFFVISGTVVVVVIFDIVVVVVVDGFIVVVAVEVVTVEISSDATGTFTFEVVVPAEDSSSTIVPR